MEEKRNQMIDSEDEHSVYSVGPVDAMLFCWRTVVASAGRIDTNGCQMSNINHT